VITDADRPVLDGLAHTLHKRVVEWYVAALAADRASGPQGITEAYQALDDAKVAADAAMTEVLNVLRPLDVGAAGYFLRERACEPGRPQLAGKPMGAWINAMWYRCDRLTEIIRS
jgi:hypothetical protein